MLRFERPLKPDDFESSVEEARAAVRRAIAAGDSSLKPVWKYRLWTNSRDTFAESQYSKCGYCEARLTTSRGEMDHYRPKGQVTRLHDDPETWGQETTSGEPVGRKSNVISRRGYWWLAYEWTNWVLACMRCNQWKQTFFPLESPGSGVPEEGDEDTERPQLLNPFGEEDPGKHLLFNRYGEIEARSPVGLETIKSLGLDRRELLIRDRRKIARLIDQWLREISDSTTGAGAMRRMRQICEAGQPEEPHAGMVRNLFSSATGLAWSWLEEST